MSRSAESPVQSLDPADQDDLRQLFATSFTEPVRDEDLRHAISSYVREAKAKRRKPELVIVSLKRAIIDAAAAKISYRAANDLTDRVVRWFIDAYYGTDPAGSDRGIELHLGPTARAT